MQIFLCFQLFSVKCPDRLGLESGRMRSCQLLLWQMHFPDALVTRPNAILTGSYLSLCFLCHPHTTAFLLIYHVMLYVCLADFSRDFGIICTSFLFLWYFLCLPLFLRKLEYFIYWFLEILCMKIIFCLYVGWILIYPCYLDCNICFCNSCASKLQAVIIPHSFWN
jgi:hypothetical protein